jgi:hypothetical protein
VSLITFVLLMQDVAEAHSRVREKINEQELYESLVCLEILMFLSDAEKSRNGFKN